MIDSTMRKLVSTAGKLLPVLALSLAGMACDDGVSPDGMAGVEIQLTDAPTDMLDSARVWISEVYLQGDDDGDEETDDEGGRFVLFAADSASEARSYDLLQLRDGVVADLAAATVEPGSYGQLRLVVDSARIWLTEGYTFRDGSTTEMLRIPSGAQTGIKVLLNGDIAPDAGETAVVVVDFDVNENFVFAGVQQDGTINNVLFTPVLREFARNTEEGLPDDE